MFRRFRRAFLPSVALFVFGVAASAGVSAAESPAGHHGAPQLGVAHYDIFGEGDTLHLLTGYRVEGKKGVTLWYRRSVDGGATWLAPVRVNADGDDLFAPHPGENPQIAAHGDRVLVLWSSLRDGKPGSLVSMLSVDGGKTFKAGGNPAADGSFDYHPLPELGADAKGFHAVWLHGATHGGTEKQGVHYAHSSDGAVWTAMATIDRLTCECCWNRVVADGTHVGVLYRGNEPRDMKFAVADQGLWTPGVAVGAFGWDFQGCPHVGGALAASADFKSLHALVWTEKEGKEGLYHVASSDAGRHWQEPQRLGGKNAIDADLARAADGSLTAVWDTDSAIQSAQSVDDGKTWSAPKAVSSGGERNRHPRTVWTSKGTLTLWLEGARESTTLRSTGGAIAVPSS